MEGAALIVRKVVTFVIHDEVDHHSLG